MSWSGIVAFPLIRESAEGKPNKEGYAMADVPELCTKCWTEVAELNQEKRGLDRSS